LPNLNQFHILVLKKDVHNVNGSKL